MEGSFSRVCGRCLDATGSIGADEVYEAMTTVTPARSMLTAGRSPADLTAARRAAVPARRARLDLDGVVADYEGGFRPYAARILGVDEAALPAPDTYDFPRAGWPLRDHDHFLQVHRQAVSAGMFRELPAYPGAVAAIRELSDRGAHIRVVTHRLLYGGDHERIVADTAHWLDKVGVPSSSRTRWSSPRWSSASNPMRAGPISPLIAAVAACTLRPA